MQQLKELMGDGSKDYSTVELDQESEGRIKSSQLLPNDFVDSSKEGRLFMFGTNSNNLLFGKGRIVTIVTSTLTTVSVKSCAAASQFIATTACRRRRRDATNQIRQQDDVSPSQVQP